MMAFSAHFIIGIPVPRCRGRLAATGTRSKQSPSELAEQPGRWLCRASCSAESGKKRGSRRVEQSQGRPRSSPAVDILHIKECVVQALRESGSCLACSSATRGKDSECARQNSHTHLTAHRRKVRGQRVERAQPSLASEAASLIKSLCLVVVRYDVKEDNVAEGVQLRW